MLDRAVIDALFPADLPEPAHWEQRYPARQLPEGAEVTRFGPSPTGFVHIGGVYAAMIDRDVAHRTGGTYVLRVEDTDQAREVEGAAAQFNNAFAYFGLPADEHDEVGDYGPYYQSRREAIYLTYVRELLREGKAYLCFATPDELADIRARQDATKMPPGYYAGWALWRDRDPADVRAKLDEGAPYVVRFRSPGVEARAKFQDVIRGELEHEDNRNDVVILKSSANDVRLPTYHFAHAVDDHLMRTTLVIRAEEWISSVPLHLQLFAALGFEAPRYAHIAPLMKQIPGGKRKLSKRKDPEASVDFYIEQGFPAEAVLYYLRGLANGRLAETPLAEALDAPIRLDECGVAGPLVDLVKLEDISADHISTLSGEQILVAVRAWAVDHDPELVPVLDDRRDLALAALAVERGADVPNPRKDLRKWSGFREAYGFFFPELFTPPAVTGEQFAGLGVAPELVRAFAADFAEDYRPLTDSGEWFDQIRDLAAKHGFAPKPKDLKQNPDAYPAGGSIREASQIVRLALTGSTRSPDLHAVATTLGTDEVLRRVRAVAG
ncbi:glutamyl-tRNA synthetase [Saccharothrix carnea]|uniref:Glutamyl-tRNA synthetase n=1 Tax=Saccharothrix carnea TaxID=1280637 RepID=A0A2P8IBM2_SACCR|nr:glutamate--tRNA ligase family protein [Saccharothrix carnea]PSL55862.1 glutamyl-tRNA synthetase [Saccharothrix carnea]